MKLISILIPCFNEADNIELLYKALEENCTKIHDYNFEYVFVDDGSRDCTVDMIKAIAMSDPKVKLIELSRNFGKEIALTAGIQTIDSDALIIMDSDLQHPPQLISTFIEKWNEGFDIVATKRLLIEKRSKIKVFGSFLFHKIMSFVSDTEMISGSTDYRLLDKKVVDELKKFTERNRLVRGLIDWLGFDKTYIEFVAPDRVHGVPGYTISKLFQLAVNSLTSFSLLPLKIAGYLGALISVLSLLMLTLMVLDGFIFSYFNFSTISYVIVANTLLIGTVLISLGFIALYIGNIHVEVTNRPIYIIKNKVNLSD